MTEQVKKQNGGKRPGAGRKKASHTIEAEKAREYLVQRIAAELGPIVDTHIELAKAGDVKALQYLLDQVAGKAKETMEIGGKDGEPIKIDVAIAATLDRIYGKNKPTGS